jgi:hypothetical protein
MNKRRLRVLGFRKSKQKEENVSNIKLAKKLLGKDSGRKIFGFPCSPGIPAQLKLLAGTLNVPIYALAEHALQLTAEQIARASQNPEERELLRKHLAEIHVDTRTLEKIAEYDADLADELDKVRHRRLEIDKAVYDIVIKYARRGLEPKDIVEAIDLGFECMRAKVWGKPMPKG